MSFSDEEQENILAPRDMAKNSKQCYNGRRYRRGDALLRRKLADHVVVSKTLYDPADTLSNRAKKRLLKEECWNDFQPDVQYSLNKHQRWKTINVPSLLENNGRSDLEVFVVDRVITPRRLADIHNLDVSNVHVKDNGTISTISTKGKGQKLSHFQATLKERRKVDKDEVEPPRILYNVVEPHPVPSILAGKTQRKNKKGSWASKSRHIHYDSHVSHKSCTDDELDERPDGFQEGTRTSRSLFTLGDFLVGSPPPKSPILELEEESDSWVFVEEEPECSTESAQPRPADLVDISAATSVNSIFEIVDIETRRLENFDLREAISLLEQERVAVRWIDSERVMVDATYQIRLSGDEPMRKPLLILFFELHQDSRVLRVRVNANIRYRHDFNRKAFLCNAQRQNDFMSLFRHITGTVRSLRLLDDQKENSRCSDHMEFFGAEVNSEMLAVKAERCNEYDKLQFLKDVNTDRSRDSEPEPIPSVRCRCPSWKRTELFETRDGMSCRDCITSYVVHQLRLNRLPVDIPLLSTKELSNIDLLYEVLPAPLISMLLKMSYSYYCRLRNPNVVFTECPRCAVEVIITPTEGHITSCVCPECESHWCWLCNSEPHWPMSCEEFKQWISKWDQQYFIGKHGLQPDEDLLRITCLCTAVLLLPSESAHNTRCRCGYRYDKTGLMSLDYKNCNLTGRMRKYHAFAGKPKQGDPVAVERIAPLQLIGKEFADICTEARNLRFDSKKMLEIEKSTSALHLEDLDLASQRKTGLILVENCTAWLYLHRREGSYGTCKSAVLRLLQRLRSIENDINETEPSRIFIQNVEALRKDMKHVLKLFQETIPNVEE